MIRHYLSPFIIFLAIVCAAMRASAQTPDLISTPYTNNAPRYNLPQVFSPNAASLGEYGRIPVDLSTGIPSICIPLTDLKGKNYDVPVNLSYHAGGHKTETHPGIVGLGWTLQAGGCINRVIHGYKDEFTREEALYTKTLISSDPDVSPLNRPNPGYLYHAVDWPLSNEVFLDSLLADVGVVDYEPDEFQMTLNGLSVSFYIGPDGVPVVRNEDGSYFTVQIDTLDHKSNPILFWSVGQYHLYARHFCFFNKFTVTDQAGIQYQFGGTMDAIDFSYVQTWVNGPGPHIVGTANTWYLTKIKTPEGEIIDFTYQKKGYPVVVSDVQTKILCFAGVRYRNITRQEPWQWISGTTVLENTYTQEYKSTNQEEFSNLSYTFLRPSHLVSVLNRQSNRQISFDYSVSAGLDNLIDPVHMMLGLGRFNEGEGQQFNLSTFLSEPKYYKLDSITDGEKTVTLHYLFSRPDGGTRGLMRLRLDKVTILSHATSPEYAFQFRYNPLFLPDYNAKMADHWGFFNNHYYGIPFGLQPQTVNYDFVSNIANELLLIRESQPMMSEAELLQEIVHPTGGITKFEYEPNYYHRVVGESLSLEEEVKIAGGVRIKSITDSIPGQPGQSERRLFLYHNSGVLSGRPKYLAEGIEHKLDTLSDIFFFLFPEELYAVDSLIYFRKASERYQNQISNSTGAIVLYNHVTEMRSDGAQTEYRYTGYDEYPDYLPQLDYGPLGNAVFPDRPVVNNSHLRGKLMSVVYYNSSSDTVQRQVYQYSLVQSHAPLASIQKEHISHKRDVHKLFVTSIPINHLSLLREIEHEYTDNGIPITQVKTYTHDLYGNITGKYVYVPDQGTIGQSITYNSDNSLSGPYSIYSQMSSSGIKNRPIEILTLRNSNVVNAKLFTYLQLDSLFLPDSEYEASLSAPVDINNWDYYPSSVYDAPKRRYLNYDPHGNPTKIIDGINSGMQITWDTAGVNPIAMFNGAGPILDVAHTVGTGHKHQSLHNISGRCVLVYFEASATGTAEMNLMFDEGESRSCYVKLDTDSTYYYHPYNNNHPPGVRDNFFYTVQNVPPGRHAFQIALSPDDFFTEIPEFPVVPPGARYFQADISIAYSVASYSESTVMHPTLYQDFEADGNYLFGGFESEKAQSGLYPVTLNIPANVPYRIDWMEKVQGVWRYRSAVFTGSKSLGQGVAAIDNIRVYPAGASARSWTWWSSGELRSETDERGETVRYRYDGLGRLAEVIDKDGEARMGYQYEYENSGQNTSAHNIIRSIRYTSAGATPGSQITEEWFDGLGRPSSIIQKGASPQLECDLKETILYDTLGRKVLKSLPIPSLQPSFYGEAEEPYSETRYDNSPLDQPIAEFGPGKDWHNSGKAVRTRRLTNDLSDTLKCRKWSISWQNDTTAVIHRNGYCQMGTLRALHTSDEDGHALITFTDMRGKTVLERRLTRAFSGASCVDTYYVYDDFGRLAAVLPPKLSSSLGSSSLSSWNSNSSTEIKRYAYLYHYNARGLCIAKKLPGSGWTLMVYDRNERLVFSQNAVERAEGKWKYVVCDEQGRECLRGQISESVIDSFEDPLVNFPVVARRADNGIYGYDINGYNIPSWTVQNVTWWDDYRFLGHWGVPGGTDPRVEITIPAPETTAYGLPTGNLSMAIGGPSTYGNLWAVHHYDDFGREIQTNAKYLHGVEKEVRSYDFTGNVTGRTLTHMDVNGETILSESYTYGYDSWSRPTTTHHRLGRNGINVCLSSNSYDAIGRITGRQRAYCPALEETLGYNVRSWLDSISVGVNGGTFLQVMSYSPLWSGNISSVGWSSNSSGTSTYNYTYDDLSRLKTATYIPSNGGSTTYKNWNYDLHGNILLEGGGISYTLDGNRTTGKTISLVEEIIDPGPFIPDPFVPVIEPKPVVIDTTAQIPLDSLQLQPIIPDAFIYDYAYDACGRMVSNTEHSIRKILYNVLDLPSRVKSQNFSAPDLYYIYAADGRKLEQGTVHASTGLTQRETYVPHITYQGNLVYVDGVLDRILFDGGYISATDSTYHFFVTDHLGSVRVVAKADGTIERCYDYEPYGRDLDSNTGPESPTPNPYKFSGKEFDQQTSHYDFGARLFSPATGRWTTKDPLCEKYYSLSPYAYCAANPVNMVDLDGRDIWEINQKGEVSWTEYNEEDILFSIDKNGERGNSVHVHNSDILKYLSNNNEGVAYYSSSTDDVDLKTLFVFLSNNTSVEWALHKADNKYTLGTVHNQDSAGNWKMFSVSRRPDVSYHSHPGINPDMDSEVYSMINDYGFIKKNPQSKAPYYYIYFPTTGSVYSLSPKGYKNVKSSIESMLKIRLK